MIRKLALVLVSLMLSLALAEGLARLVLPSPQTVSLPKDETAAARLEDEKAPDKERKGKSSQAIFIETEAGRRLRANAHVRITHFLNGREIDFRTNSIGYRNREIGPKTLTRVLFLGDSITGGDYLEEPETFVRQVEALSWKTDRPIETINAGIGAISMSNEIAILEETGLSTNPDVVVLCFYLNDFQASFGFQVGRLPGWLDHSYLAWLVVRALGIARVELETRTGFGPGSLAALREELDARLHPVAGGDPRKDRAAFYAEVRKAAFDWGGSWSERIWDEMTPLFEHFRALADEHHFQPLIVVFPVDLQARADFVEDYPQRQVAAIGKRLGIPVFDPLPMLRAQPDKDALYYDQCHYKPPGNALIAAAILDFLRANVAIPKGEVPASLRATPAG